VTQGEAIVLAPHNPEWAAAYASEAASIVRALSNLPIELEHIGSTAIPGIVAKPVIDMLGAVPSVEKLDEHSDRLTTLGYEALGEFGIAGRRYFRKNAANGVRTHHLHVFAVDCPEIARHLNFRDYLRAFPMTAVAYSALKQDLAKRSGDTRAYTDGKTAFVRAVDLRALAWAARNRLQLTRSVREGTVCLDRFSNDSGNGRAR